MSSMHGTIVSWVSVNGIKTGVVEDYLGNGDWLVKLDDGKHVIVNEKSFIHG